MINRFISDLDVVMNDLSAMEADHEVWQGLNNNISMHPWAGAPGELWWFITRSHFAAFGTGLRRQLDLGNQAISLAKLIEQVAERSVRIQRERFVGLYTNAYRKEQDFWKSLGESEFVRLCGGKECREYPADRAFRHLQWLKRRGNPVKRLVDKTVAHRDRDAMKDPPLVTIRKFERLLWAMQRLWEHYRHLATGAYPRLGDGAADDDWMDVLKTPWSYDPHRHRGLCTYIVATE